MLTAARAWAATFSWGEGSRGPIVGAAVAVPSGGGTDAAGADDWAPARISAEGAWVRGAAGVGVPRSWRIGAAPSLRRVPEEAADDELDDPDTAGADAVDDGVTEEADVEADASTDRWPDWGTGVAATVLVGMAVGVAAAVGPTDEGHWPACVIGCWVGHCWAGWGVGPDR